MSDLDPIMVVRAIFALQPPWEGLNVTPARPSVTVGHTPVRGECWRRRADSVSRRVVRHPPPPPQDYCTYDLLLGVRRRRGMAIYGFLLFKFSAHKGQGHKPVMLNSLDGQHFFHLIDTDLRKLKEDGTLAGKPQSQQPDLDSDVTEGEQKADHSEAVLKVESISTMGHVVRFTVRYGREGAYDIALSAVGDPDIDLTSRAPSRLYRGAFIVPPNGTRGFVAIETISRVRPLTSLLKWLRFKSPVPWRIKVDPTIDSQEFERALEESSNVYLEFEKRQPSEDNTPAREKKLSSACTNNNYATPRCGKDTREGLVYKTTRTTS
jgi:hypothetical protein